MKKKDQLRSRMQGKLTRDPNNPFAAWDEEGRPCLPMTIDDDSPSKGTPGIWEMLDKRSDRDDVETRAQTG